MSTFRSHGRFTLVAALLLTVCSSASVLHAETIRPGLPAGGGLDFVWVHDGDGWHIVPVEITAGMTVQDKAAAIQTALNEKGYDASVTSNGSVSIAGGGSKPDKWEFRSYTGESDQAGQTDAGMPIGEPTLHASLGFEGDPTGIAFAGTTAAYLAQIVMGDTVVASTVPYSSLSAFTIDEILTLTYGNLLSGLTPSLQGFLSLDVLEDRIWFRAPITKPLFYVTAQSLDVGVGSVVGGATVPEPAVLLLLGTGMAACARVLRRKELPRGT